MRVNSRPEVQDIENAPQATLIQKPITICIMPLLIQKGPQQSWDLEVPLKKAGHTSLLEYQKWIASFALSYKSGHRCDYGLELVLLKDVPLAWTQPFTCLFTLLSA